MANHYTREIPTVSNDQREQLQRWLRRQKTSQALASRARIILNSAEGHSDQVSTTRATANGGGAFCAGCDGLLDEPRSGTPRSTGTMRWTRWWSARWSRCPGEEPSGAHGRWPGPVA